MNQARKRTGTKKVLSMILVLVMLLSLLSMAAFTLPAAASSDGAASTLNNRIVHLDCGRKYFSVTYIKGVIDSMAENGFNQLELAFGNGGLRFVLDDLTIKDGSTTLFDSYAVKAAVLEGNNNFYDDPNGNALTEDDMKSIISYAENRGVEIVPLLNMPGHMDGLLSSSLFSKYKLSGSDGSLDLNNANAVTFGKALLKLYVDWFKQNANLTSHFNFGADEYGQGIRNPYIESYVANVTYNQLINYMNDCANVIETENMTARCFNDFVCYNRRTVCNLYKTVEVCYWSNQWNGSEYNTPDVIKNAGYKLINTNQKWYFVPSKADEYGKSVVESNLKNFDVTKFQNIKYGYNSNSTTYTQIPVGSSNVGAMFCVWSDTPSVDVPLKDVQDLIAAMATANSAYFTKKPTETQNTFSVTASSGSGSEADTATLTVDGTTTLTATTEATWTSSDESVVQLSAAQTANAAKAAAVSTAITGTAVTATAVGAGTATITATSTTDPSKTAQITLTVAAGDSALRNVTLPINLWITNTGVVPTGWTNGINDFKYSDKDGNRRSIYTLRASVAGVATENGIELSSILNQDKKGTATSSEGTYDVVFWKNAYHDASHRQSTDGWTNESLNGTEFQYIRYWNENWAYSTDGTDWVTISNVGAEANDTDMNQVNIWYRQKTAITDEVTTEIVDWGPIKYSAGQCLLDFAVKYESGDKTPTSFPVANKTIGFACPTNQNAAINNGYVTRDSDGYYYRTVYGIAGVETSNYEVYMITVTPSANDHRSTINAGYYAAKSYSYAGTEKVAWAKTKADADNSNLTKTDDITYGGEAFLKKVDIYQYQGLLITYYVRDKSANLTVHYVDQGDGNEFHSYGITTKGETFNPNIRLNPSKWQGPLLYGTVTNIKGKEQTVSADLSDMPSISAKYRYATDYKCVKVETKNDRKDVYLYYTFNNKVNYVIDFGLPLEIKLTDLSAELGNPNINITKVAFFSAQYGTLVYDSDRKVITYKLNGMLSEQESFTVEVEGTKYGQKSTVAYIVTIIPASTVYYEDNFVKFSGSWEQAGKTEADAVQHLDELGKTGANNYGYDAIYKNSSEYSLGSARKTTVRSATNSNPPTATFTFKGTGFDLVSMTSKDTGTILVDVNGTTEDNETVTKRWIVDTFYGYTRQEQGVIEYTWTKGSDGTWHNKAVVKETLPAGKTIGGTPKNNGDKTYEPNYIWTRTDVDDNALYQIPVIHYTDLPYGTYTVTVTPKYSSSRDPYYQADGNNNNYDFYLDGVRIYNPAGDKLNSQYVKDGEGYAQFTEIRNMLLNASDLKANIEPEDGMVFMDGVGNGQLADYTNYGPNNEVYLSGGQAIAFKISDMSNVDSIQIGAKAPKGNATMQIQVGGNDVQTQELNTASDMYYKLNNVQPGQTIVITNAGDNLLSLTTLKVTYNNAPTETNSAKPIVDSDVLAQAPVMLTSMLYGEPETFEPEHFTAKWSRNVRKGGTATLTVKASADVESITVNGEKITAYTTKTERSFWGPKETYHVFTYRVTNAATADYTVCALNAEGVASDPITAPLTVRPSIRDWWHGIFDKWF